MASIDPSSPAMGNPDDATSPAVKGKKRKPYLKLPGRMATFRVGAYGIKSLYLGDDHLLQVDTVFFVEHYKRFAYADIQALVLRQTWRGLIMSLILGVLAAAFGAIGWSVEEPVGRVILWVLAGFFGLLLIVNMARSATCRCQLETAIGPQPLLSLSRVRPARKAFARISERIAAAQGTVEATEAARKVDEMRGAAGSRGLGEGNAAA